MQNIMQHMKRLKWLTGFVVFIVSLIGLQGARPALAGSPTEAIKETIDTVFAILHDPVLKGDEKKEERNMLLRKTVAARFDFQEMAKRALGPYWKRYEIKQEKFAVLFADLLGAVYLDTIEWGVKAEAFYLHESVEGEDAEVDTKIVPSNGEGLEISYKLHMVEGEWKAYDVLVEHISMIQNYRSQFYHILGRHSFDELLERMRKKIEALRKWS